MKVKVHSIHFDADQKLIRFIQQKVDKLEQFYDGFTGGEVFLRLDRSQDNKNKITEIRLNMPGKDIFAKRQSRSFEEATDHVVEALRKQLRKHKGKVFGIQHETLSMPAEE